MIKIEKNKAEKKIITALKSAGYSPTSAINITQLRREKYSIYKLLTDYTLLTYGNRKVNLLLERIGYEAGKVEGIEKKAIEELKRTFPKERIEQIIASGESGFSRRALRKDLRYVKRYETTFLRNKSKKLKPLRALINQLYPEYPKLAMYITGVVRQDDFSVAEAKDILNHIRQSGESISRTYLSANYPLLFRWISNLRLKELDEKQYLFKDALKRDGRCYDMTRKIELISGVKRSNFSIRHSGNLKDVGNLSEQYVKIVLLEAAAFDPLGKRQIPAFRKSYPLPIGELYPLGKRKGCNIKGVRISSDSNCGKNTEESQDKRMYADIIMESENATCLIEVKNVRKLQKNIIKSLEERLNPENIYWSLKNKKITNRILVVHSEQQVVDQLKALFSEKARIIDPASFGQSLEIALNEAERRGHTQLNLYSANELLKGYHLLTRSPHQLTNHDNKKRIEFLDYATKNLIHTLHKEGKNKEQADLLAQTNLKQHKYIELFSKRGNLYHNKEGAFELFKFSLEDIPKDNLKNIKNYIHKKIKKLPEDLLFMDVESCGFIGSMIFLIGTAYRQDNDLKFELAFARNPFEEGAMLHHFAEQAKRYGTIATYNGRTFDFPAIERRFVSNMMPEHLPLVHDDIYQRLNKTLLRKGHPEGNGHTKLTTLSKLFGDQREDISGKDVPLFYDKWIETGDPAAIDHNLEHNALDLATTAAVYLSPNILKKR